MSNFSTQPYKGTRDFYPDNQPTFVNPDTQIHSFLTRQYIFDTWRKTLITRGFVEYDTSILEQAELYIAKSGEDLGRNQLYTLTDKSDRRLALRPELTPSLARMVADKYKEIRLPLRWFAIPNCFRYEKPQKGRLREHWQLNVDMIGLEAGYADLEILELAISLLQSFGATPEFYQVQINSKQTLDQWFEVNGWLAFKEQILPILDDWLKLSVEANREKLSTFLDTNSVEKIIATCQKTGEDWDQYLELAKTDPTIACVLELKDKIWENIDIELMPNIVRGQAYYTGLVFEIFDKNPNNPRSLFGGGRYDNLMSLFDKPQTPAVGFGMGDVTFEAFLTNWNLLEQSQIYLEWLKNYRPPKIGLMPTTVEDIENIYTNLIPEFVAKNWVWDIDYDFERNPKKRIETLKKRGCSEIWEG